VVKVGELVGEQRVHGGSDRWLSRRGSLTVGRSR
jgi:hypothetical protein